MEGNPALAEATLRSTLSELSAQGVGGGWSVTDDDDRAAEQVQALWEVCTSAFRASPGPALAALLEMVATIDHPMASIAAEALEHHLLAPDAGPGVGNGAIDAANGQAQNGGNGPPVARSLAAAAFIAAGSLDDIQAAVQAVQKFCRGVASGAGARLRSSLQDLGADLAPYARKSASKKSPSPAPGSTQPGTAAQGGGKRRRPSKWADSATAAAAPSKAPTRPRKAPSRQATPSQLEEGELNEPGQLRASSSPTGGIGAAPVGASQPRLGSEASFPRGGAYPPPGGPVTLAAACLHFWGLPRVISDQELGDACARFGRVVAVAFPPGPADGTGYVTFKSLRDASRCYEAMAAQTYFRGGNALRVSFCATEARPPGARGAPGGDRPATHVWVAGPASPAEENDLLADISAGGGGTPEHMLRVEGRWPGVVLAFSSPQAAEKACQALTHKPPRSRAPDMGRGRGRTPPMDAAGPPGRGRRPDHEVADLAHRTLWVGQVPPGQHAERELLSTFGRFGELVGHRFMHRSGCAFVDYARLEDAVEVS